jgi:hypothetical protein
MTVDPQPEAAKPSTTVTQCGSYREAKALAGERRRGENPNAYVVFNVQRDAWCVQ